MNRLDYVVEISEDSDTLAAAEREAHHVKERQRLQLLRLLKSGLAMSMPEASALVGISPSTADRHWRTYKREGLAAMCSLGYKGGQVRLSPEELQRLDKRVGEGFPTLQSAVTWVQETFAVSYTQAGLWTLFQRLGYKAKTGRPCHHKQDLEAQADFKKNSNTNKTF